jgi:hypothetical protein
MPKRNTNGQFVKQENEYIFDGDICRIIITSSKHGIKEVLIDTKNYDLVKNYCWSLSLHHDNIHFYIVTKIKDENKKSKYTFLRLHRIIMNCPEGFVVDHYNHDTFNNLESNLRICSSKQNSENQTKRKTNTSGYKNVSWNKHANKWRVNITHNGKKIHIGYYDDLHEANQAAIAARDKYFTHHIS